MSVVIDLGSCLHPRTISEATHSFVEYCACDIFLKQNSAVYINGMHSSRLQLDFNAS